MNLLSKEVNSELETYTIATDSKKSMMDQFMQLSRKKLQMNLRTKQTFYNELILPFVIILIFLLIGEAEYVIESPGLDLQPEVYE